MKKTEFDLDIIGPYPPPFGGISIHISRILPVVRASGLSVRVFNHYYFQDRGFGVFATKRRFFWWLSYLFRQKAKLIHIHQFSWLHFPYVFILSRIQKNLVFLTIHNEKLLSISPVLKRMIYSIIIFSKLTRIICVSSALADDMRANGVYDVMWLSAYVPPAPSVQRQFPERLEKNIAFNAWKIDSERMCHSYGLDLLLAVAKKYPSLGFHLFIGDKRSYEFLNGYLGGFALDNIFVIYGQSMVEFLASADLFLRLNRDDAYGVSIKEAMDLGVPALASNVCVRPKGCILFDVSDFTDLCAKFEYSLNKNASELLSNCSPSEDHDLLVGIYKETLGDVEKA